MTTKNDIIAMAAERSGRTKVDSSAIVDAAIAAIGESLAAGERVQIAGLGIFKPVTRAARAGRNPATGAAISIPEKRAVTFKPAVDLTGRL